MAQIIFSRKVEPTEDDNLNRPSGALTVSLDESYSKVALLVTACSGLAEQASLLLAAFALPYLSTSPSATRRVLISLNFGVLVDPILVLLRLEDGTVLYEEPGTLADIGLHATAVVPNRFHGDAPVCDPLIVVVRRIQKVAGVHGVHHVPYVVQPEVPITTAGE